jgi:ubiquinone biosynthesis protein
MVFKDGFFHADLHAGNLVLLDGNVLGMIDFGVVGRLNRKTQDAIASMLLALATEDYDRLAYEFVDLAPYNRKTNVDQFARDLRELIAPFYGLTMQNVNMGKLLLDSTGVAARHHLVIPSELMLFFKSMVTVEGLGHMMVKDFDLLPYTLEFATELVKTKYDPHRISKDFLSLGRDTSALLTDLPRQLRQLSRKINSPDFALRVQLGQMEDLRKTIDKSASLVFIGLLVSALVLSGTAALFLPGSATILDLPVMTAICFSLAFLLSLLVFRR